MAHLFTLFILHEFEFSVITNEQFSIECRKTKTKPITYQSQTTVKPKPKPKPKFLFDYFRRSIENRSMTLNSN